MKCPNCGRELKTGQLYCESCGQEIQSVIKKNGEPWPAEEMKVYSVKRYGRPVCGDCMKKEAAS